MRKLIIGLAILALVPLVGCQRMSRIPEMISRSTGLGASSAEKVPATVNSSSGSYSNGALQTRTISAGGLNRTYYIYAPASASSGQPAPMVLAFHGGGGGATQFAQRMDLVNMAERYGMVLVLPQGAGRPGARNGKGGSWNADSITPSGYAENNNVNDLAFVDALLRSVPSSYAVDRSRIYAIGFSKGGMMAYRAACVLNGQITAIAAVSATLSSADCPNPQGVSVLHIHGTDDRNVPLGGGVGEFTRGKSNWPAVGRGIGYFTSGNQCAPQGITTRPSSDTTCTAQQCGGNEKVELCLVQGGGHAWPGAEPANWQIKRNVYVSQKFDATDYIARFLLNR